MQTNDRPATSPPYVDPAAEAAYARWLRALERIAGVGCWRSEGGRLVLSEEARRLVGRENGERAEVSDLLALAPEGERERFGRWWGERPAAACDVTLLTGSARRQLRFTAHDDGSYGFVQALEECQHCEADRSRGTGLPDRAAFGQQVARAVGRAGSRGHRVAVLLLRPEPSDASVLADASLRHSIAMEMQRRLRRSMRDQDVLARLVGDPEDVQIAASDDDGFLVMLELQRPYDASNVGRRLIETLCRPIDHSGRALLLHCEGGIALHPEDGASPDELIDHALVAADAARGEGVNALQYHSRALNAVAFEKANLENRLRTAIDNGELELFYQPKVEIATERIAGFEALIRWRHPELGLVSPAQFIPLAEETGMIIPIGCWVLRQACRDTKKWQEMGLPPIRMAVNLSSAQFREPRLFESVMEALDETGLDAKWLELELTESMLMHDVESAAAILRRLKAKGIHISIDDFGTGYSSLSYLKRFPIDALKIDRSFIREINTNPDDAAISTSIILMGRSLKLRVIAEGVETRSQLAFLRVMQCDEAQGFLFSQPVPEPKARALLEAQPRTAGAFGSAIDAA